MPGLEEAIPFSGCDAEIEHPAVRALCEASLPIIEANEHVVWAGDLSDTKNSSYLLFFEVSAFELFVFPVDGAVLSCISDYHRRLRRAVFCFIHETGTSGVALYHFVYSVSDGWFESESFPGFLSDRAQLSSSSFVLEDCNLAAPFAIYGTTQGVQSIKISHNDMTVHPLANLEAVKLLRHHQCNAMLYILTLDGVQVYNVRRLQAEPLQPLNWSVAELSLDGTRVAFAGSHHDQSCWIQVWNTTNQEVVRNVTRDDCNIASIAVSKMHVCYHMTDITGQEWKLACLVLGRNSGGWSDEVVLAKGSQWVLRDRALTLDGNVLVERIWDAINLYHVLNNITLHRYQSKYPTLAYLPGTSGAQDNPCRIPPTDHSSPTVQHHSTSSTTSLSESATTTEQPSPTTGSKPGIQASLLVFLIVFAVVVLLCIGVA